jgi:hypothetical protein
MLAKVELRGEGLPVVGDKEGATWRANKFCIVLHWYFPMEETVNSFRCTVLFGPRYRPRRALHCGYTYARAVYVCDGIWRILTEQTREQEQEQELKLGTGSRNEKETCRGAGTEPGTAI